MSNGLHIVLMNKTSKETIDVDQEPEATLEFKGAFESYEEGIIAGRNEMKKFRASPEAERLDATYGILTFGPEFIDGLSKKLLGPLAGLFRR